MNFQSFIDSLSSKTIPQSLSTPLQALWYDFKNDWEQAHNTIQHEQDKASALVHAYLHRKEGDIWNARHWYKIAGRRPSLTSFESEREQLVIELLAETTLMQVPTLNSETHAS